MQKKKFVQNITIIVLAVAIIVMSVGYATYYTPLEIKGTTTIEEATWDVHFADPVQSAATTVASDLITPASLNGGTKLTFGVEIPLGNVYEFTAKVKNAGTFNAKLSDAVLTAAKDGGAAQSVDGLVFTNDNGSLTYSVTWADGSAINTNDVIEAGKEKTIKVRVEYKDDTAEGFNAGTRVETQTAVTAGETASYVFTATLTYDQAN